MNPENFQTPQRGASYDKVTVQHWGEPQSMLQIRVCIFNGHTLVTSTCHQKFQQEDRIQYRSVLTHLNVFFYTITSSFMHTLVWIWSGGFSDTPVGDWCVTKAITLEPSLKRWRRRPWFPNIHLFIKSSRNWQQCTLWPCNRRCADWKEEHNRLVD